MRIQPSDKGDRSSACSPAAGGNHNITYCTIAPRGIPSVPMEKVFPRRTLSRVESSSAIFERGATKIASHTGARVVSVVYADTPDFQGDCHMPRRWTLRIHGARMEGSKLPLSGRLCSCERVRLSARQTEFLVALYFARMSIVMNYSPNVTAASEYFQAVYHGVYLKMQSTKKSARMSLHGASRHADLPRAK